VCHQTVGLVARAVEEAGIATMTVSVGLDITRLVRPPRTAFLNYPMGNETGRPGRDDEQRAIVQKTLEAAASIEKAGEIVDLGMIMEGKAPGGGPWQDWVYTKDFRDSLMRSRS
jgi:D-proline reductase (dithiol) PrdB